VVKILNVDDQGKIRLSRKAVLREQRGETTPADSTPAPQGGGQRPPRDDRRGRGDRGHRGPRNDRGGDR